MVDNLVRKLAAWRVSMSVELKAENLVEMMESLMEHLKVDW